MTNKPTKRVSKAQGTPPDHDALRATIAQIEDHGAGNPEALIDALSRGAPKLTIHEKNGTHTAAMHRLVTTGKTRQEAIDLWARKARRTVLGLS